MSPIDTLTNALTSQLQGYTSRQLELPGQAAKLALLGKGGAAASAGAVAPSQGFGKVLGDFVSQVDDKMKVSRQERTKVLTGESTNLHQAMIASQEASVAFSFMLELRNKLVESYQELMRAQV